MRTAPWTKPDVFERRPALAGEPKSTFQDHLAHASSTRGGSSPLKPRLSQGEFIDRSRDQTPQTIPPRNGVPGAEKAVAQSLASKLKDADLRPNFHLNDPAGLTDPTDPIAGERFGVREGMISTTAATAFSFLTFGMFAPHRPQGNGGASGHVAPTLDEAPLEADLLDAQSARQERDQQGKANVQLEKLEPLTRGAALIMDQLPNAVAPIGEANYQVAVPAAAVGVNKGHEGAVTSIQDGMAATEVLPSHQKPTGQFQLIVSQIDGQLTVVARAPELSALEAEQLLARASNLVQSNGETLEGIRLNGHLLTGGISRIYGGRNGASAR